MIVVLFSSVARPDIDADEYGRASARMREIVASVPGFIAFNTYSSDDGEDLVVARFDSLEAVDAWRNHPEHLATQERDRSLWAQEYWVQTSETVREYRWTHGMGYESDLREMLISRSEIQPGTSARQTSE